ncbi:MAG TPA: NAD(P)-dependent oxidoreductase [Bryobacteraceae bacterium]|nr:NAD(P)-dependent oxidoreductase [Bryobacteraceae bacterium]
MSFRTSEEIAERFAEIHPPFDPQSALVEANRCLYCFDAPCTAACPTHIDVPRFIKKIATGNLRGSASAILDANILGSSCSRVCPVDVLCEGACVMHRYNKQPIEIGRLQRHAMDHFYGNGAKLTWAPAAEREQKVACIGAGPASLACAVELRKRGYGVTIFESRPLAGGLNTYGVAEYKLRPSDSLREVELVKSLGVEFCFGVTVGNQVTMEELESRYAAVFLAVGLGPTEPMNLPGEDLDGVVDALRFIADYKTAQTIPMGRKVAVIGGGNTAIDAANAARRLGAAEVYMIYRRGEREMPAFLFEYEHSKLEGVQFRFQTQPVAIRADSSDARRVGALECVRMELGAPDSSGRRKPEPVAGSNFLIECDMVIPAIGQSRFLEFLAHCRGIEVRNGTVVVDPTTGRTANPRYYAGGDCVNGGREVVDAVAEGKRAGQGMARWLERKDV